MTEIALANDELATYVVPLMRLQRAAYAVEAALIGDDRIPALHESEDELIAADLSWLAEIEDDYIVGALAYRLDNSVMNLARLIVDPQHHRRGIGARLVTRALRLARDIAVSTGRDNAPARQLYERFGFTHRHDREIFSGLWISDYYLAQPGNPSPPYYASTALPTTTSRPFGVNQRL